MIKKIAMVALVAVVGSSFAAAVSGSNSLGLRGSYVLQPEEMEDFTQIGVAVQYRMPIMSKLDLVTGLGYEHIGFDKGGLKLSGNNIDIGIGAEYGILQGQMINPFVRAQVNLIYWMMSSEIDFLGTTISDDDSDFEVEIDLGAGVEIDLGIVNLRPNFAYQNTLTEEEVDDMVVGIDAEFSLSGTMALGAGVARALDAEATRLSLLFRIMM